MCNNFIGGNVCLKVIGKSKEWLGKLLYCFVSVNIEKEKWEKMLSKSVIVIYVVVDLIKFWESFWVIFG